MKRILMFFLILLCGLSMSYAQSYDLNKDGKVNSSDVVALYNYIESGSASELTKDDIVGTWKIMYEEYSRWENDVLVEEKKGNVEEENNYYVYNYFFIITAQPIKVAQSKNTLTSISRKKLSIV